MSVAERLEAFAARATFRRLLLAIVLVGVALAFNHILHEPIEAALRGTLPAGQSAAPVRPEMRAAGYSSGDLRHFVDALGPRRADAIRALLISDPPLILALGAALFLAAALASRDLPIRRRTRLLILSLPVAFALFDLVEDALLVATLAGVHDGAALLPWASAAKFGTLFASLGSSAMLGFARFALDLKP